MNGDNGAREGPPVNERQVILGGPTIRITVEMQIRDRAAHWQETIRLAPGSGDSHAEIAADMARKAVKELTVFLAIDRVEHRP